MKKPKVRARVAIGALVAGSLTIGAYSDRQYESPEFIAVSLFERLGGGIKDCRSDDDAYYAAMSDTEIVQQLIDTSNRLPSRKNILWQYDTLLDIASQEGFTLNDPRDVLHNIAHAETREEIIEQAATYLANFGRNFYVPSVDEVWKIDQEANALDINLIEIDDLRASIADVIYAYSLQPVELIRDNGVESIGIVRNIGDAIGRIYPARSTALIAFADGMGSTAIHEESHGLHFTMCGIRGAYNDDEISYLQSPFSPDYITEYAPTNIVEDFAETSQNILTADTLIMGASEDLYSSILQEKIVIIVARYNVIVPGFSRYWVVLHEIGLQNQVL